MLNQMNMIYVVKFPNENPVTSGGRLSLQYIIEYNVYFLVIGPNTKKFLHPSTDNKIYLS